MIDARDAVVWINRDDKTVMVQTREWGVPEDHPPWHIERGGWGDPIGAAYTQWQKQSDAQRVQLMLETALDLAMQGFPLKQVLTAFATVRQFRALGGESYPMCRALTAALIGKSYEANTMTFEQLLVHYAPERVAERIDQ